MHMVPNSQTHIVPNCPKLNKANRYTSGNPESYGLNCHSTKNMHVFSTTLKETI